MREPSSTQKVVAEFIGTFALVFLGCQAIMANQLTGGAVTHVGVALSFGLALMVSIFAVGHISGGHFNPAVSLAVGATGNMPTGLMIQYWIAQILGGLAAAVVIKGLFSPEMSVAETVTALNSSISPSVGAAIEAICTFFLAYSVMAVVRDNRPNNIGLVNGLVIGGTLMALALSAGALTGGSFNPARSLGPAIAAGNYINLGVYVIGPLIGGLAAGFVYTYIRGKD